MSWELGVGRGKGDLISNPEQGRMEEAENGNPYHHLK
jgi:hypothetical protein